MTRAGMLHELVERYQLLGPKPPRWRPLRRYRWQQAFNSLRISTTAIVDPAPSVTIQ